MTLTSLEKGFAHPNIWRKPPYYHCQPNSQLLGLCILHTLSFVKLGVKILINLSNELEDLHLCLSWCAFSSLNITSYFSTILTRLVFWRRPVLLLIVKLTLKSKWIHKRGKKLAFSNEKLKQAQSNMFIQIHRHRKVGGAQVSLGPPNF